MNRDGTLQPMGREKFRTPDGDVAAEFERVCQLFQMALGKPSDRVLFDSLMVEASEKGLNWVEGLEYVVQARDSAVDPRQPSAEVLPMLPLQGSGAADEQRTFRKVS